MACATGRPEQAAGLFGAAAALRGQHSVRMIRFREAEYESAVAAARACLAGEAEWSAAWALGQAWALDETLTAAMSI